MRLLIISLLVCFCMNKSFGQVDYEAQMLALEKQIYYEENDSLLSNYALEKFNLSIPNGDYERSFMELKRVNDNFIVEDNIKKDFFWNAALVSKLSSNYEYANIYYDLYLNLTNDTSYSSLLLGLLIKEEFDTVVFKKFREELPTDSILGCVNCFDKVNAYKLKRKGAYVFTSRIFPGLGTMLTGDFYNGFGSIFTVGGSGYGVYYLINNEFFIGSAGWGYLFFLRFYKGNINLTKDKVQKLEKKRRNRLAKECYSEIEKVLIKYPIDFRLNQ